MPAPSPLSCCPTTTQRRAETQLNAFAVKGTRVVVHPVDVSRAMNCDVLPCTKAMHDDAQASDCTAVHDGVAIGAHEAPFDVA